MCGITHPPPLPSLSVPLGLDASFSKWPNAAEAGSVAFLACVVAKPPMWEGEGEGEGMRIAFLWVTDGKAKPMLFKRWRGSSHSHLFRTQRVPQQSPPNQGEKGGRGFIEWKTQIFVPISHTHACTGSGYGTVRSASLGGGQRNSGYCFRTASESARADCGGGADARDL